MCDIDFAKILNMQLSSSRRRLYQSHHSRQEGNFLLTQKLVSLVRALESQQIVFFLFQNVKAYLRRGTAREMLGAYKEAMDGKL